MKSVVKNNRTFIICMIIWCFITLLRLFAHQPWFDESYDWLLAEKLSVVQLFEHLHIEGHTFVWFFLIMPFAKLNLFFPYSMYLINWLFCFFAIIILWKKAPFNNFLKILITFSFPFLTYYPIVARCYSIGIFLLFVLTAMFSEKTKHPIIYAWLIFICANTSVIATIGAFCFAIFLFYELIKQNKFKEFVHCSVVGLLFCILFYLQLFPINRVTLFDETMMGLNMDFFTNFCIFPPVINLFLLCIFLVSFTYFLIKDKKILLFLFIIYTLLLCLFHFCYFGSFWHWYFFYIYLIIAVWLGFNDIYLKSFSKRMITVLLCVLSFCFVLEYRINPYVYQSDSKIIANSMIKHKFCRVILFNNAFIASLPYLHNKNVEIYHYTNHLRGIKIKFEDVKKSLSKEKENYGYFYSDNCDEIQNLRNGMENIKFIFDEKIKNKVCVYKIVYNNSENVEK